MSLEEIISAVFEIVVALLSLAILFSFFTSRKNRKEQLSNLSLKTVEHTNHQVARSNNVHKEQAKYFTLEDKDQLKFPFVTNVKQMQISHREELVKEYFQTRKRYTVVNTPYSKNISRASNFY